MNATKTKGVRDKVLVDMGYEPNEQETRRDIFRYPEFRKIFRAAKKNALAARNRQYPKLDADSRGKIHNAISVPYGKKNEDVKRNRIAQRIVCKNGYVRTIFHNKPFRDGNYKEMWDQENTTKVRDRVNTKFGKRA